MEELDLKEILEMRKEEILIHMEEELEEYEEEIYYLDRLIQIYSL